MQRNADTIFTFEGTKVLATGEKARATGHLQKGFDYRGQITNFLIRRLIWRG